MNSRTRADESSPKQRLFTWKRLRTSLGPGVIAGAADDDPSGIATYSMAGAQFGLGMLWVALVTWPLMASVQMMCARIGMVTGRGLGSALKKKFPRTLVVIGCIALLGANVLNIAADLAGMADAFEILTGINSHIMVIIFAVGISWATVRLRYAQIAHVLKWLAVILFAYVLAAIEVRPSWSAVLRSTLIPSIPHSREEWQMLVAILGTTISPYLFFWQASQEVEEEKASGRRTVKQRQGATADEILDRKLDVGIGTLFSNVVMFFIIVTTAATLHEHGVTNIQTSAEAAQALKPIGGSAAMLLYSIGIVGVGLLAIPTLSGSAAYALAEVFGWRQGLDQKIDKARSFYAVVLLSTGGAILIDFMRINPVKALFWSAVVNGVLAPLLLAAILVVAVDAKLMSGQPSSFIGRVAVVVTTLLMAAGAIVMFVA